MPWHWSDWTCPGLAYWNLCWAHVILLVLSCGSKSPKINYHLAEKRSVYHTTDLWSMLNEGVELVEQANFISLNLVSLSIKFTLALSQQIFVPQYAQTKNDLCSQLRLISLGICPAWSVFAVRMKEPSVLRYPLNAQQRLIRLDWCPGTDQTGHAQAWLTGVFVGHTSFCWFCHAAQNFDFATIDTDKPISEVVTELVHSKTKWAYAWQNQQNYMMYA